MRSRQIEGALTGRIYDPYVRLLLWEGVRSWWRDALPVWLSCAPAGFKQGDDATVPSSTRSDAQLTFLDLDAGGAQRRKRRTDGSDGDVICPFVWASETHRTTCALGFPANYDDDHYSSSMTDSATATEGGNEDGSTDFGRLLEVGGQSPFYRKIRGAFCPPEAPSSTGGPGSDYFAPARLLPVMHRHESRRTAPRAGRTAPRRDAQHDLCAHRGRGGLLACYRRGAGGGGAGLDPPWGLLGLASRGGRGGALRATTPGRLTASYAVF